VRRIAALLAYQIDIAAVGQARIELEALGIGETGIHLGAAVLEDAFRARIHHGVARALAVARRRGAVGEQIEIRYAIRVRAEARLLAGVARARVDALDESEALVVLVARAVGRRASPREALCAHIAEPGAKLASA